MAALDSASRSAQLRAVDRAEPARSRRPHRLLDVLVRELAADAALRPSLVRKVPESRARRYRSARSGILLRARRCQRHAGSGRSRISNIPLSSTTTSIFRRAFGNNAWPAVYLVDQDGRLRYRHLGEDAYDETERAIQQLLGNSGDLVDVNAAGFAAPADWENLKSPETYLGSARGERGVEPGPHGLALNQWTLTGKWHATKEAAVPGGSAGSIKYYFEGRDVNLVMGPPSTGGEASFVVRLDGEPPETDSGIDCDDLGAGTINAPRMYQLVRQRRPLRQRTFEITFLSAGATAYVFTFG